MTKARKIADLIGKLAACASIAEAEGMIQKILDEPDDKPKCAAVVGPLNQECPNTGINNIYEDEYLCDNCFKLYNEANKKQVADQSQSDGVRTCKGSIRFGTACMKCSKCLKALADQGKQDGGIFDLVKEIDDEVKQMGADKNILDIWVDIDLIKKKLKALTDWMKFDKTQPVTIKADFVPTNTFEELDKAVGGLILRTNKIEGRQNERIKADISLEKVCRELLNKSSNA